MSICTKCNGEGIIGNGPNPHLQEGQKKTCDACNGTGQIADQVVVADEQTPILEDKAPEGDQKPDEPEAPKGIFAKVKALFHK